MTMRLKDLPVDMQKKYIGQIDVDGMIRVQYYPEDLAYALGMDDTKIADVYVEMINNIQVLRITAIPIIKEEFKTVRVAPKDQTRQSVRRKQTGGSGLKGAGPVTRAPKVDNEKPFTPGEKLVGMAKTWMQKKTKPDFMKDAGF
jgi:hypothetical protein